MALVALIWLITARFAAIDVLTLPSGKLYEVSSRHTVEQTFIAPQDGLSRVDSWLSPSTAACNLTFQVEAIKDAGSESPPADPQVIRQFTIPANSIDPFENTRFEFDAVPDSGGKAYAFRLTSDCPAGQPVLARGDLYDTYAQGRFFSNGALMSQDMSFSAFHQTAAADLLKRIEPFRPPLLDSRVTFILLFLAGGGIFGWLLWHVAAGGPSTPPGKN